MATISNNTISCSTNSNNACGNEKPFVIGDIEKLYYEIYRFSSFTTNYFPDNILVDCPNDQTSRWSAQTNSPPQYLTLKLKRPAIVKRIKFGKFDKAHVCNIKKFRIYGGLEEDCMALLLEAGLKNDNKPETFNLRHITEDGAEHLPILYLKIVPLLSWGPTFNFSIWYVELHGQDDPMFTSTSMRKYNMLRETEVVRLCLKHFRQQGYDAAFKALQEQTQVRLEYPLITELHKCLVMDGDFVRAEKFIVDCVQEGLMDSYLLRQHYKYTWRAQQTADDVQPGKRGGHQLVLDSSRRLIYLYGGWDGYRDLSDLWVYDINKNTWHMLFEHSEKFNGPSPRSCHKMIFDPVSENIFILGRYLENAIRTTDYIKSDFYLYDTRAHTWLQICDDTSQVNGPQLVYDHQMCIDAHKRTIYVFGGKILTPRSVTASTTSSEPEYSGLFSYHIATNTWTQIFVDCHHPSASQPDVLSIKSRITHCMVFHTKKRKLYIYGGQRGKEDIDEFMTYDVDTQSIEILNKQHETSSSDNSSTGGDSYLAETPPEIKTEPSPGYTLRATIDCERDEIYVFSSLSKVKDRRENQQLDASNSFWVYSLQNKKWTLVYSCRQNAEANTVNANSKSAIQEPCPRYAHQLIYDDVDKIHYLFGGNPGKVSQAELRLDDFWLLELEKPKRDEILRHCRYLIRKLHYEEMARSNPYKAMQYLRNDIAEVINHADPEQLSNFHKLASLLFKTDDSLAERSAMCTPPLGANTYMETADNNNICEKHQIKMTGMADNEDNAANKLESSDELSSESYDSITATASTSASTSSLAEMQTDTLSSTYNNYRKAGGKRARHDYIYDLKSRRSYLFNKLVQLMPANMVQPERNLSDFVVM